MGNSKHQTPPREWIAEVYGRLELPLLAYVAKRLGEDREAARDIVQEAFVKLCQQAWPDIESHTTAWMYCICRNRAIDIKRREGRMGTTTSGTDVSVLHDRQLRSPEQSVEQGEQIERVRLQVDQLPDKQREILRLRLHDNLSYKQIAEVTGMTVTNVGYLLHQAIASLRARTV